MNFNLRMLVSFGLAVLLHCLAVLAAVLSCGSCNAGWVPDFMTGESSLELSVAARIIDPPPAPRLIASGSAAASCAIERSSGFPALDQAALHAARRARYVSAQPAAQAAHGRIELDFRFQLTD